MPNNRRGDDVAVVEQPAVVERAQAWVAHWERVPFTLEQRRNVARKRRRARCAGESDRRVSAALEHREIVVNDDGVIGDAVAIQG